MSAHDGPAAAFTYAWWLTGDKDIAAAAVRAASDSPAVLAAGDDEWLTALLREVRAAAAPVPTMCPASEVALLHDVHGLALEEAAAVAAVDPADARTELAHGRLEALTETVIEACEHPERLGGLAVANPPDVAHARQCASCGQARELLDQGRAELRDFADVTGPRFFHDVPDQLPGVAERLSDAGASLRSLPGAASEAASRATARHYGQLLGMGVAAVVVVVLLLLFVFGGEGEALAAR